MPNKIFLVLWLFLSVPVKAQPPLKVRSPMIDRTNNLLAAYDPLNPWQEYTRLRDIPFDQKKRDEIRTDISKRRFCRDFLPAYLSAG